MTGCGGEHQKSSISTDSGFRDTQGVQRCDMITAANRAMVKHAITENSNSTIMEDNNVDNHDK
jgi:hypothetical protein